MRRFSLYFVFVLLLTSAANAAVPDRPLGYVSDYAYVLSSPEIAGISTYLVNYGKATTNQVVVVIIPTLEGMTIEDYSIRLAEKWKIGHKGKNNGVILLIAMSERKMRIEVGYGLEPSLTDASCGVIIRSVITPYFREKKFYEGIMNGVQAIAATIAAKPIRQFVEKPPSSFAMMFKGFIEFFSGFDYTAVFFSG